MKKRKGPAQSGFNAPKFNYVEWAKEQRQKRADYLERQRIRQQLTLPLDVPRKDICPECGCIAGKKCKNCNSTGFIYRPIIEIEASIKSEASIEMQGSDKKISLPYMLEEEASVPKMGECPRCRGVGQIANREYLILDCPRCKGSGRVEVSID